jgi:hypothetical protein
LLVKNQEAAWANCKRSLAADLSQSLSAASDLLQLRQNSTGCMGFRTQIDVLKMLFQGPVDVFAHEA